MATRAAVSILNCFQKSSPIFKRTLLLGRENPGALTFGTQIRSFFGFSGKLWTTNIRAAPKICNFNELKLEKGFHTFAKPSISSTNPLLSVNNSEFCHENNRTVTRCSMRKGTRKTVKTVTKRFYRLEWGAWIRTYGGRFKGLYKKHPDEVKRLRRHIFVTHSQSRMFDKMVTKFWRKPKFYVDDPYESYHKRSTYWITKHL